jgi:hypothetical protein
LADPLTVRIVPRATSESTLIISPNNIMTLW